MGTRNEMGDHLLDFLSEHDLLAANTCFQHSSRHKTTFTGWRKDWSAGRRAMVPSFWNVYEHAHGKTAGKLRPSKTNKQTKSNVR